MGTPTTMTTATIATSPYFSSYAIACREIAKMSENRLVRFLDANDATLPLPFQTLLCYMLSILTRNALNDKPNT